MTTQESMFTNSHPYTGEASVRFLRARFESEELSPPAIGRWLVDHLGPEMTSAVADGASSDTAMGWAVGTIEMDFQTEERLRLLYRVCKPVFEEFGLDSMRDFIAVNQATLASMSIIDTIASDDPRTAYDKVVPITRMFVGVD